jgi:hypothetical protein
MYELMYEYMYGHVGATYESGLKRFVAMAGPRDDAFGGGRGEARLK